MTAIPIIVFTAATRDPDPEPASIQLNHSGIPEPQKLCEVNVYSCLQVPSWGREITCHAAIDNQYTSQKKNVMGINFVVTYSGVGKKRMFRIFP